MTAPFAELMEDFKKESTALWMLIGLVGAGKTTFAQQLWAADPKRTIRSSLDEIIQMMSFYHYEPTMSGFYGGIERSTIVEGLLDGYKVIVDRTNITSTIRGTFIQLVSTIRAMARDLMGLLSALKTVDFFEQCERELMEKMLIGEGKENVTIYTPFLKLIRDWKAKSSQPLLFSHDAPSIRKRLDDLTKIQIVGVHFAIPQKRCMERRNNDPQNAIRDTVRKINWKAVIKRMAEQFECPRIEEGFDQLYRLDEQGNVERYA